MTDTRPPLEVVNEYLSTFYTGDFDRAAALVGGNFRFRGPFVEVHGKDAFLASAAALQPIVRGHRLLQQWVNGDEVCSIFELLVEAASAGTVTISEWHTVRGGTLTAALVLFDSPALRALLPPPPTPDVAAGTTPMTDADGGQGRGDDL